MFVELPIFLIDLEKEKLGMDSEDIEAKAFIDLAAVIAVRETMKDTECCIYLNNDQSFIVKKPYLYLKNILPK